MNAFFPYTSGYIHTYGGSATVTLDVAYDQMACMHGVADEPPEAVVDMTAFFTEYSIQHLITPTLTV